MDVKTGHCWRCELRLPNSFAKCSYCRIASYCSEKCLKEDVTRHFVECDMWKPRSCDHCGKKAEDLQRCSGCFSLSFCGNQCQENSWSKHSDQCQKWKTIIKDAGLLRKQHFDQSHKNDLESISPEYFSNMLALDILNLPDNELNNIRNPNHDPKRDFKLLLAGCNDICHLVYTIHNLPPEYLGRLHFVLNDSNWFVMARNVLLLFMIFSTSETGEKSLRCVATVWMSTRLSLEDFALMKESLAELFVIKSKDLSERTNRIINIPDESLEKLRTVWEGWNELVCHASRKGHFDLQSQRQTIFEIHRVKHDTITSYRNSIPKKYVKSVNKWIKNGIVDGTLGAHKLPYYNPTMTSLKVNQDKNKRSQSPRRHAFAYCVPATCFPFQSWDFLEVHKHDTHDNAPALYHTFVTNACQKTKQLMDEGRLSVEVAVEDFRSLSSHQNGTTFDRIFTSSLADEHGHDAVTHALGPLLSKGNPSAVLLTSCLTWASCLSNDAKMTSNAIKLMGIHAKAELDTAIPKEQAVKFGHSYLVEYYNNNVHFINYLRAEKFASTLSSTRTKRGQDDQPSIPSWEGSTTYHRLKLRNFRKGLNQVVPFRFRRNVRTLNMLTGFERVLEWYRPTYAELLSSQYAMAMGTDGVKD